MSLRETGEVEAERGRRLRRLASKAEFNGIGGLRTYIRIVSDSQSLPALLRFGPSPPGAGAVSLTWCSKFGGTVRLGPRAARLVTSGCRLTDHHPDAPRDRA